MRIVIDMQGAQGGSRKRGIGRYALEFAKAFVLLAQPRHEILFALNGAFDDSIDWLEHQFDGLLRKSQFRVFRPVAPCHALDEGNLWRRQASELLYERFIATLRPDFLLITSLFEGQGDDCVISIEPSGRAYGVAAVLHDLMPLLEPEEYLNTLLRKKWYYHAVDHLKKVDLLLANSDSSRQEALQYLNWPSGHIVTISAAADSRFCVLDRASRGVDDAIAALAITKPFVLFSGAFDERKNVKRLIAAFARLPAALRQSHQLVLVHSIDAGTRGQLQSFARQQGLQEGDLVLPGWVSDDDLVTLYNGCAVFVFPSLHEGFGLPVLEAMACGAPVLAADATSLPEVIGRDEALFDPLDVAAQSRKIAQVLSDPKFAQALRSHGLQQAKQFSWSKTAQRALKALEDWQASRQPQKSQLPVGAACAKARPRLAFFSPLQPAKSGIADYSAELLPELSRHYDIDVIVQQDAPVTDPWVLGNAPIRTVAWFERNARCFDRVLYQFGNSEFHAHEFDLLQRYPGVVVLHDFYLSAVLGKVMDVQQPGVWPQALLESHGWQALIERHAAQDPEEAIARYPGNLAVLQAALGVIVHAEFSRKLAAQFYGNGFADDWHVVKHLRQPVTTNDRAEARVALGLDPESFVVCSFGFLDSSKLNHRLLAAWAQSELTQTRRCKLIFVGQNHGGDYGAQVMQASESMPSPSQIRITGWTDEATYRLYLQAADAAVQLRANSRGETSGTVLDCLNFGLPTIVNANGSNSELPQDALLMLPDAFSDAELVQTLESLWHDPELRATLSRRAQAYIRQAHDPRRCATRYAEAIETAYANGELLGLARSLPRLGNPANPHDLALFARRAIELQPPKRSSGRQLLFDISELAAGGDNPGIHRVALRVLDALLNNPPEDFRIEPIYATAAQGYRYARRFTADFLKLGDLRLEDDPVDVAAGDVLWGLDWAPDLVTRHWPVLAEWRQRGVKVYFTVHDILPLIQAETTFESVTQAHRQWLEAIAHADGLLSVSRTVMEDVHHWLQLFGPQNCHPVYLGWAHHGADLKKPGQVASRPTRAQTQQLAAIERYPAFLLVGTLEPRKMQDQALAAFEWLWRQGIEVSLVIVGKVGWKTERLADRLRQHPERGRHLFWLEGISDDYLEQVYQASTCLIAASKNEGFGLPLIEAAMRGLPILARDIPIFREVCGEHAAYFRGYGPQDLAQSVQRWLDLWERGQAPNSAQMPWMTWAQATRKMLDVILHDQWQSRWEPKADPTVIARYWGSDDRLKTTVGMREGRGLVSTGRPGHFLYGPYLRAKAGRYVAELRGRVGAVGCGDAMVDVCVNQGKTILREAGLSSPAGHEGLLVRVPFALAEEHADVEIRIEVTEHSDLFIDELLIRRASREEDWAAVQDVFKDQREPRLAWWGSHPKIHTEIGVRIGREMVSAGGAGYLIYANYTPLSAGRYRAQVHGISMVENSKDSLAQLSYMDVAWNKGTHTTARIPLKWQDMEATQWVAEIDFELDRAVDDAQVRVWLDENNLDIRVQAVRLIEVMSHDHLDLRFDFAVIDNA